MTITPKPDQEAWLESSRRQAAIRFRRRGSRQLIDERIAERAARKATILLWAQPYVDEALADIARGGVITLEEHEASTDARLAAMN